MHHRHGCMAAMSWVPNMQVFISFMLILGIFLLLVTTTHSNSNSSLLNYISNVEVNTFPPQHRIVLNESLQQLIRKQTHVSTTLATYLLSKKHDSNVVFSPLSIHAVLSMLAAGFNDNTPDQLLAFLKTNTTDDLNSLYSHLVSSILADGGPYGGPRLTFANAVWVNKSFPLKPYFKQVLDIVYKAAFKQVDCLWSKAVEVANEINLWAEKKTNGLIKEVIRADAINRFTDLIFTNAVYFKGTWSQKFYKLDTKESDFHLLDGNKVQIPFMSSEENQFVCKYDGFKVLGLPYQQGQDKRQFTMYFLLPDAKDDLQSLVEKIGSTPDFLERHIPREKVEVGHFLIPKFKISFGFEAYDRLKQLGLLLPDIDIHHKSFVEVDEEGTEAAAVTAMMVNGFRSTYDKINFVADHPFLFVIREDVSGVVLFMGKVIDPSVGSRGS